MLYLVWNAFQTTVLVRDTKDDTDVGRRNRLVLKTKMGMGEQWNGKGQDKPVLGQVYYSKELYKFWISLSSPNRMTPCPVLFFLLIFMPTSTKMRASLVAQTVKNLPAMQETWIQSLSWEDTLERVWQHLSILAWRTPMNRGAWLNWSSKATNRH